MVADMKQVVVVRTDLGMGKGKIAAQVGHACVLGADNVRRTRPEWHRIWWDTGQKKVVLRVPGIRDLREVRAHAIDLGVPWYEVTDAGHTQLAPGTATCLSVGPLPEDLADRLTGGLKLL